GLPLQIARLACGITSAPRAIVAPPAPAETGHSRNVLAYQPIAGRAPPGMPPRRKMSFRVPGRAEKARGGRADFWLRSRALHLTLAIRFVGKVDLIRERRIWLVIVLG